MSVNPDSTEKFGLISKGDSYTFQREITPEMVETFAELSGDYNPIHMDNTYCIQHGLESRIVHGMLVLSLVSAMIGMHLPGEGTVWLSQSFDFISPARIGDVLIITGRVTEKDSSNLLGLDILTIKIVIRSQEKAIIVRGSIKVLIK